MAYLSLHKTRDDIFLYGCSSLRTVKGPRCIQQCLGKVDKISLKITINSNFSSWIANNNINNDYINHFLIKHSLKGLIEEINIDIINNLINDNCISAIDTNTPTNENKVIKYCDDDILTSKVESIGLIYLLNNIANSIGLTNILQNVFPNSWEKILILAQYQVATHSPFLYLQHWAQNNSLPVESNKLASQRITELLKTISIDNIYSFYDQWNNYRQENEFLACDITSISSYSSKISDVAYGYNRDKENLKQINLCLLFGEESGLPVFSVEYNGSLNDVKTFHT
ncbi:MAG: hypothetical protein LBT38_12110, partial [Deltaproteobacteria bacterium]|nr:hypothetical protein [Deltaproteobacteria bacterium]